MISNRIINIIIPKNATIMYLYSEITGYLFETLFDQGFIVTDFITHQEDDGRRRSYYLLTRVDAPRNWRSLFW